MLFLCLLCAPALAGADTAAVSVAPRPARVLVEAAASDQRLNFDFVVRNPTRDTVRIRRVEVSVRDRAGALVLRRDVDGSGASPAILTLRPDRELPPGDSGLVFNPFASFAPDLDLASLRYRFELEGKDTAYVAETEVRPERWAPRTALVLPLAGRQWVLHGHDFLAHHRRWNPLHPVARMFGATGSFSRYALDLVPVDERGEIRRGRSDANDDFFGWGAPLRAPGDGVVLAAYDGDADDDRATRRSSFDPERLARDPMHFYGNYVVIDHGGGEVSLLGHLMRGSVTVRPGERVRAGQAIARMGASGSAEFVPHLHYELRTGPGMAADGLPAYFRGFRRLLGSRSVTVDVGPVDSGDFLEAR